MCVRLKSVNNKTTREGVNYEAPKFAPELKPKLQPTQTQTQTQRSANQQGSEVRSSQVHTRV